MNLVKPSPALARMREAGRLAAAALDVARESLKPGMTTAALDHLVDEFLLAHGAQSSVKGRRGYPAATCICVNDELVHGVPSERVLRAGDLVTVDIGARWRGFHADTAWTFAVGEVSDEAAQLLTAGERALWAGIAQARAGLRTGAISHAIESSIRRDGFEPSPRYGGHGVGRQLHEPPLIANVGTPERGIVILPGMMLAIEPVLCAGSPETRRTNRWTVVTADGSLSAQFEHTVAITEGEAEVLTTGIV